MMKTKSIKVMVLVCAVCAGVAWCSGFDFDHRGPEVAVWVAVAIGLALVAGLGAACDD